MQGPPILPWVWRRARIHKRIFKLNSRRRILTRNLGVGDVLILKPMLGVSLDTTSRLDFRKCSTTCLADFSWLTWIVGLVGSMIDSTLIRWAHECLFIPLRACTNSWLLFSRSAQPTFMRVILLATSPSFFLTLVFWTTLPMPFYRNQPGYRWAVVEGSVHCHSTKITSYAWRYSIPWVELK